MSYSDLQSSAQNLVTSIAASSEEELSAAIETNEQYAKQYAKQYGREYTEAEAVISLLQSWLDTTSDAYQYEELQSGNSRNSSVPRCG